MELDAEPIRSLLRSFLPEGVAVGYHETYEFFAIDRPLGAGEMKALRGLSSRATITPTRFYNFYDWGGLKADPRDMLGRYFDLCVYTGEAGVRWGMLRLPAERVDRRRWRAYLPEQRGVRPPTLHLADSQRAVDREELVGLVISHGDSPRALPGGACGPAVRVPV